MLVVGSGISGLLHIQLARVLGASLVVAADLNHGRLEEARKFGAHEVVHAGVDVPGIFRDRNGGRPADIVILTTGSEKAIAQAFRSVDRGVDLLPGELSFEEATFVEPLACVYRRNEITLTSSYAANYYEHSTAMELIRQRKVNVSDMVTHRLPLSETAKGFRLVESAGESLKVIIEP
ncbi:MAG: zinc-binding dehydrogenase [Candidatus Sulfobium sp.]